jgi:hypothetical protein
MRTLRMSRIVFLLLLLARSSVLFSQQGTSLAFQLSDLDSAMVEQRMAAYMKIKDNQDALRRADVKAALINLLDRENRVVQATLDSPSSPSVDEKYGEGYSEYLAELTDTVGGIADWHDPRQLCVLAQSSYNPDSAFAAKLATRGGASVAPCLLKMSQGNIYDRKQSIAVLVHLSVDRNNLPPSVQQQIHKAILGGLQDREVAVREVTIEALEAFGTPDMIPILQEISRTDPYSRPINEGKGRRFDVREAADKAILAIQEREKTK